MYVLSFALKLTFIKFSWAATTLSDRYARAIEHEERTADHLAALEDAIGDTTTLARWQRKVDEWVERILHREEEIALEESPYEIGQAFRKGMCCMPKYWISAHSFRSDDSQRASHKSHARVVCIKPKRDRHAQRP